MKSRCFSARGASPRCASATVLAVWGALVIGGVYMTRADPQRAARSAAGKWNELADATLWRKLPYALLLASLLVFGCFPRLLTEKIQPDVKPTDQPWRRAAPGRGSCPVRA